MNKKRPGKAKAASSAGQLDRQHAVAARCLLLCPGVKQKKLADEGQIGIGKDVHGKKDERPRASAAHKCASARTQEGGEVVIEPTAVTTERPPFYDGEYLSGSFFALSSLPEARESPPPSSLRSSAAAAAASAFGGVAPAAPSALPSSAAAAAASGFGGVAPAAPSAVPSFF